MYTMLEDSTSVAPRESLGVMIDLYRRNVWYESLIVFFYLFFFFVFLSKPDSQGTMPRL